MFSVEIFWNFGTGKYFQRFIYLILHETFSNSCGLPLAQKFNPFYTHLVLCDRNFFFFPILTDSSNLSFLFHQVPLTKYDLENVLTKQFPKMQKQSFTIVLQNTCSYKFPDIYKKISVLKSFFLIQLEAWRFTTLIKRRPQHKCFPVNITKFLRIVFFMEHLWWLPLNMVGEFLRIS